MHIRKFTLKESVRLTAHYERHANIKHYGNSDVDKSRSHMNYNLAPERDVTQIDYIKKKLEEIDHVNRNNLIVMSDLIITQPLDLASEDSNIFFQAAYDFCVDRYGKKSGMGEDCIVSSYVHLDETTPHMHLAVLPVVEKTEKIITERNGLQITEEKSHQRFCAKEFVNREELRTLHKDLQKWLDDKGIKATVLNGKTKYDSNGRALSVKELKRSDYKKHNRWNSHDRGRNKIKQGRW